MPVLLLGDATAMLQMVDGAADRPIDLMMLAGSVVDSRLVTTAAASDDQVGLEAFDAAVGSAVNESRAA